jgi:hypothetical protein
MQSVSKNTGRERYTAMPNIESASQPRFNGPTIVLNKFDGH